MTQRKASPEGNRGELVGASPLFLSLYIILLTFFIALVSVATPNSERTRRVVDSVLGVFSTSASAVFLDEADLSQSGRVLAVARQVFADVGSLFQAEIPAATLRERVPGRVLEVSFSAKELFADGQAVVRPSRQRLFDGLVAALSYGEQEGISRRMLITLTTGEEDAAAYRGADSLEHRRAAAAGAFAFQRGAPAGAVEIGLAPGPLDQVVFTFRVGVPIDTAPTADDAADEADDHDAEADGGHENDNANRDDAHD